MNANKAQLIHALRGPVLLVTLGVLMLIHQAGWASFGQTWPALLIVFGTMWLAERANTPPPYAPPPMPPPNYTAPGGYQS